MIKEHGLRFFFFFFSLFRISVKKIGKKEREGMFFFLSSSVWEWIQSLKLQRSILQSLKLQIEFEISKIEITKFKNAKI